MTGSIFSKRAIWSGVESFRGDSSGLADLGASGALVDGLSVLGRSKPEERAKSVERFCDPVAVSCGLVSGNSNSALVMALDF